MLGCYEKLDLNDILNKSTVLVLNRSWEARIISTQFRGRSGFALSIRQQETHCTLCTAAIRVPTVIIALNFAKAPKKRPSLCAKGIPERDGNRCHYTGKLRPHEGGVDHILPRSRDKDAWENLVWSGKTVNAKKSNRLVHEAGSKLFTVPSAPKELPATRSFTTPGHLYFCSSPPLVVIRHIVTANPFRSAARLATLQ